MNCHAWWFCFKDKKSHAITHEETASKPGVSCESKRQKQDLADCVDLVALVCALGTGWKSDSATRHGIRFQSGGIWKVMPPEAFCEWFLLMSYEYAGKPRLRDQWRVFSRRSLPLFNGALLRRDSDSRQLIPRKSAFAEAMKAKMKHWTTRS